MTVTPMFWVLWGFFGFFVFGERIQAPNDLIYVALYILAIFISILGHELGHAYFLRRFGRGYVEIVIDSFFGSAQSLGSSLSRRQQFIMTAAGPLMNLFLAGAAFVSFGVFGRLNLPTDAPIFDFFALMTHWNILLMVLNLIPVFPLDGGRLVDCMVKSRKTTHLIGIIAFVLGVIYCFSSGYSMFGVFLGFYGYQNFQRYQQY